MTESFRQLTLFSERRFRLRQAASLTELRSEVSVVATQLAAMFHLADTQLKRLRSESVSDSNVTLQNVEQDSSRASH